MTLILQLKGSLFDEELIGSVEVREPLPEVGDVVECDGRSYTITDLIRDEAEAFGSVPGGVGAELPSSIAIVEPLAVSQRRGGKRAS